ncbi:hypothetical protein BGZ67_004326 [Mortierella alpina]|nr:hypothetical protein BGZ67_004326 [Mortierella alpina]
MDDDNASVVFSWSDNDDELKDEISALEQSIDTQIPPNAVPEIVNEDPNRWRTPAPLRQRIRKWDMRTAPIPTTSGTARIDSGSNTEQFGAARRGDVRSDIEKLGGPTWSRGRRVDIRTLENTPSAGRDLREEIQVMTKTFGDQALGEQSSSASAARTVEGAPGADQEESLSTSHKKQVEWQGQRWGWKLGWRQKKIKVQVEVKDKGGSITEVEVKVKVKRTAIRSEQEKKHLPEQNMGEGYFARQ